LRLRYCNRKKGGGKRMGRLWTRLLVSEGKSNAERDEGYFDLVALCSAEESGIDYTRDDIPDATAQIYRSGKAISSMNTRFLTWYRIDIHSL